MDTRGRDSQIKQSVSGREDVANRSHVLKKFVIRSVVIKKALKLHEKWNTLTVFYVNSVNNRWGQGKRWEGRCGQSWLQGENKHDETTC